MIMIIALILVAILSFWQCDVEAFSTTSGSSCCSGRTIIYPSGAMTMGCYSQLPSISAASQKRNVALWLSVIDEDAQQSMLSMECDTENDPSHHSLAPKAVSTAGITAKKARTLSSLNFWKKSSSEDDTDGLTFKQKLAKAGMSTLLSYGFVSNMSYAVTVSIAWYLSSKRTGLSPLAKGQWPGFLAVYSGFYVFNSVIRPVRFTLSIGVSRYFDNATSELQRRLKCSKPVAIGFLVFLANVCGTSLAMGLGISLASKAAGVPVWTR